MALMCLLQQGDSTIHLLLETVHILCGQMEAGALEKTLGDWHVVQSLARYLAAGGKGQS